MVDREERGRARAALAPRDAGAFEDGEAKMGLSVTRGKRRGAALALAGSSAEETPSAPCEALPNLPPSPHPHSQPLMHLIFAHDTQMLPSRFNCQVRPPPARPRRSPAPPHARTLSRWLSASLRSRSATCASTPIGARAGHPRPRPAPSSTGRASARSRGLPRPRRCGGGGSRARRGREAVVSQCHEARAAPVPGPPSPTPRCAPPQEYSEFGPFLRAQLQKSVSLWGRVLAPGAVRQCVKAAEKKRRTAETAAE